MAVANAASLTLARFLPRRTRWATQRALGAETGVLVREVLFEAGLLALAASTLGVAGAAVALPYMIELAGSSLPRADTLGLDLRVAIASVAVTCGAVILASVGPLLTMQARSGRDSWSGLLRGTDRSGAPRRVRRSQASLVALQSMLAVALLVGTGLLARSLLAIQGTDPGFETTHLQTVAIELATDETAESEGTAAERIQIWNQLSDRLGAIPGVERVAFSGIGLPFEGMGSFNLFVEGQPRSATPEIVVHAQYVSPTWFETLGIGLRSGRLFESNASWDRAHEAVVNATFARPLLRSPRERRRALGGVGQW